MKCRLFNGRVFVPMDITEETVVQEWKTMKINRTTKMKGIPSVARLIMRLGHP